MIIGCPEFMTLAHMLDWLLALIIFTLDPPVMYITASQPLLDSCPICYWTQIKCNIYSVYVWAEAFKYVGLYRTLNLDQYAIVKSWLAPLSR